MRDEGITQALTGDQHFEQAGFSLCSNNGTSKVDLYKIWKEKMMP
jgi:hypothetical protein